MEAEWRSLFVSKGEPNAVVEQANRTIEDGSLRPASAGRHENDPCNEEQ